MFLIAILALCALPSFASMRWRTRVDTGGVTVWRGLGRRTLCWRDVLRVSLELEARSIEVAVRRSDGRTVTIRPTDGDLIGVLVTARAALAATDSPAAAPSVVSRRRPAPHVAPARSR